MASPSNPSKQSEAAKKAAESAEKRLMANKKTDALTADVAKGIADNIDTDKMIETAANNPQAALEQIQDTVDVVDAVQKVADNPEAAIEKGMGKVQETMDQAASPTGEPTVYMTAPENLDASASVSGDQKFIDKIIDHIPIGSSMQGKLKQMSHTIEKWYEDKLPSCLKCLAPILPFLTLIAVLLLGLLIVLFGAKCYFKFHQATTPVPVPGGVPIPEEVPVPTEVP